MPRLKGDLLKRVREAIKLAFNIGELKMVLSDDLEIDLANITLPNNREEAVFELLGKAEREGWTPKLLDALKERRSKNEDFRQVMDEALEKLRVGSLEEGAGESAPAQLNRQGRFALVIGISQYQHGAAANQEPQPEQFINLGFAAQDARAIYDFLHGQDSTTVTGLFDEQATLSGMLHALDVLRQKCHAAGPDPTVLVYFSGHGACDIDGRSYLVPYDGRRDDLFATALWNRHFDAALDEIGTNQLAVLLDTCRAEALGAEGVKGPEIARFDPASVATATKARRRFVVASCKAGQNSFEDKRSGHGIFTRCLLELLRCDDYKLLPEEIDLYDIYQVLREMVRQAAENANFVQEPFASFTEKTGVVVAINERKRRYHKEKKMECYNTIYDLVSKPESVSRPVLFTSRPVFFTNIVREYIEGKKLPQYDVLYEIFDEAWRTTPPCDSNFIYYVKYMIDAFEKAPPASSGPPRPFEKAPRVSFGPPRPQGPKLPPDALITPSDREPEAEITLADAKGERRLLNEGDVDHILDNIQESIIANQELFKYARRLRKLLERPDGVTQSEVGKLLLEEPPGGVPEEQWVEVGNDIRQRFKERWDRAEKVQGAQALALRVAQSAEEKQ